jgi:pyruvate, orthophosphate dikinase
VTLVHRLDQPPDLPLPELTELLGGKAANLAVMTAELGLPVPPAIAVTTAACRAYLAGGWPDRLADELRAGMGHLETVLGRRFGDPADPLLVSVRSGAPVSMPGMMDTILDLGLNRATAAGLAAVSGDPAFAADCQRRFREMFSDIVGQPPPEDAWAQLRLAIEAVFRSWNSPRATVYRRRESIPDEAGTGVTIQAMVFGNRGPDSASGVVFTRNPATGEPGLYGDVLFSAQGEDVVAGNHPTQPLAVLDERLPDVARQLRDAAARLETEYRDLCDIEFTIEAGRLWLLQVRIGKRSPQAALRLACDMADDPAFPLTRREAVERTRSLLADPPRVSVGGTGSAGAAARLASGLGASPGVASGAIVTSPDAAAQAADEGRSVILVRAETSPDDVQGMARAAGILTSKGGIASHAAVVARGWAIPAVVGAREVEVAGGTVRFPGTTLHDGDEITIDGASGAIYRGIVAASSVVVPEAARLLGWARDLGIAVGAPAAASPEPEEQPDEGPPAGEPPTLDLVVHALRLKGLATLDALADAVASEPDDVRPLLDELVGDGLAGTVAGAYRLTDAGRDLAGELVILERDALGLDRAVAALDGFLALDQRIKAMVTDWQLRPTEAGPAINDHADAAYDAAVLARLADVHRAAVAWISPLEDGWPRASRYRGRLASALAQAQAGDGRFVASPRVESYHGVWFELHEDLIGLAGRTRAGEVAAGRA